MKLSELIRDLDFADERAQILKALGHPVRLRLVAFLATEGERTVTDICRGLHLPQAKVSQQLGALRLHHLVQVRKQDGFHHYSLSNPALVDLLTCLTKNCRTAVF